MAIAKILIFPLQINNQAKYFGVDGEKSSMFVIYSVIRNYTVIE